MSEKKAVLIFSAIASFNLWIGLTPALPNADAFACSVSLFVSLLCIAISNDRSKG